MTVVSTEEDLEEGRVAYLWGSRAILVTSLFLAAVAISVSTQVPLDTTMAYSRSSGAEGRQRASARRLTTQPRGS